MPEFTNTQIAAMPRKLAHEMASDLMGNGFDEPCDETRLRDEIEAMAVQLEASEPVRLLTATEG